VTVLQCFQDIAEYGRKLSEFFLLCRNLAKTFGVKTIRRSNTAKMLDGEQFYYYACTFLQKNMIDRLIDIQLYFD